MNIDMVMIIIAEERSLLSSSVCSLGSFNTTTGNDVTIIETQVGRCEAVAAVHQTYQRY